MEAFRHNEAVGQLARSRRKAQRQRACTLTVPAQRRDARCRPAVKKETMFAHAASARRSRVEACSIRPIPRAC